MKAIFAVLLLCLLQNTCTRHFNHGQANNAFNNWLTPTGPTNTGNAFNKWLGGGSAPPSNVGGSNPAFNNWINNQGGVRPGQPGQPGFPGQQGGNPAFANWLNNQNGGRPGTPGQPGSNPFADPSFANALRGQINRGANNNLNAGDNAFRAFLQSNNIPNATQLPSLQECARYTIRAGGNVMLSNPSNYRVTCTLPNGRNYTENCYGQQSCDYLTCKFLKCSQVPGGRVFRVKI